MITLVILVFQLQVTRFSDNLFSFPVTVYAQKDNKSITQNGPSLKDNNLRIEPVARGIEFPTSMSFLDHNDILVTEKNSGIVKRILNGTISGTLLDVNVANGSERGLLGIAISDKPKYVFLFYTETENIDGGEVLGNRLYRYEYDNGKLINPKLLLDLPTIPGPSHNGGVLKIGPDKKSVYVVIGNLNYVQNQSYLTKAENNKNGPPPDGRGGVLRITFDGGVVDNKGLLGDEDPLNKYYAYGIRNSFGMDFDPVTGELWDTENGPGYGDEVNFVQTGFNSGWNKVQGLSDLYDLDSKMQYDPDNLVNFHGKGKYSEPEFVWNEPIGITALKFLNSDKLGKNYENDVFVGDFNNGNLYHFDLNGNRTSLSLDNKLADKIANNGDELKGAIFGQGFGAILDIEVGHDGYLYILSLYDAKDICDANTPYAKCYNFSDSRIHGSIFRIVHVNK